MFQLGIKGKKIGEEMQIEMQIAKRYLRSFLGVFFLFLAFALIKDAEAVKYYWTIETVDSGGDVGLYTSLALDSSNKAYISYRDGTNADLKYATNASGSWVLQIVDSTGDVGQFTSIALDTSNKAYISYRDETNTNLKYATNATGAFATVDATIQTADGTGNVGNYTSIALDSSKKAYISYHDGVAANLKYTTNASGSWALQTVDSTGSVGTHTSIALDSSNKAYISYNDGTNPNLKYATNATGPFETVNATIQTADSPAGVGEYTSIALDSSNNAYISHYDSSLTDLKYTTNASGSWVSQTVDSTNFVGKFTSIALDSSNNAHISYYTETGGNLKYATNASGSWVLQAVDSTGVVGKFTSIALDSSKNTYISYYDETNGNLKYAFGEVGNLLSGANTDVLISGGAGVTDGVTVSSMSVTGDGRIRKTTASALESAFLASSLIGDTFMRFDLVLDDATLTSNATVVINYTSALLDPGFTGWSEEQLQIFRIPTGGGTPTQLTVLSRDTAANTITVSVPGFSTFAVGVNPEPATLLLLGSALFGLLPLRKRFLQK